YVLQAQPQVDPITTVRGCGPAYEFAARPAAGDVLTENTGAALMAGKPLFVSNPFVLAYLVRSGKLSDAPLVAAINQRRFSVILLAADLPTYLQYGAERWSPASVDAMARNYRQVGVFACQDAKVALVPRTDAAAGQPLRP